MPKTKYWYKVYGVHKKHQGGKLYVGDVIATNKVQAMNKASRKFGKWKITDAKRSRVPSHSEIIRYL